MKTNLKTQMKNFELLAYYKLSMMTFPQLKISCLFFFKDVVCITFIRTQHFAVRKNKPTIENPTVSSNFEI